MYAVIETGGKQYRVQNGDQIQVEKLDAKDGSIVEFDKVLLIGDGDNLQIGSPYLEGTTVSGTVLETAKANKVIIFKYKAKKDYRKKQGHRQPYTLVEINAIGDSKVMPTKAEPKTENVETEVKEETTVKKPALKSMKKAELIEFAKENNIEINEKATNAVMIETIEAALK